MAIALGLAAAPSRAGPESPLPARERARGAAGVQARILAAIPKTTCRRQRASCAAGASRCESGRQRRVLRGQVCSSRHFRTRHDGRVSSDFGTSTRKTSAGTPRNVSPSPRTAPSSRADATYQRRIRASTAEEATPSGVPAALAAKDRGRNEEPYVVVGDRVRMRGRNLMWRAATSPSTGPTSGPGRFAPARQRKGAPRPDRQGRSGARGPTVLRWRLAD